MKLFRLSEGSFRGLEECIRLMDWDDPDPELTLIREEALLYLLSLQDAFMRYDYAQAREYFEAQAQSTASSGVRDTSSGMEPEESAPRNPGIRPS